jgi:predicted O-methyltransferase YrrM
MTLDRLMFFRRGADIRPLTAVTTEPVPPSIEQLRDGQFYADVVAYFTDYPERSLMSDDSRAVLFSIIRARRSKYIAEIGTFRAGTTEVMARACWENNWGIIYTTDPYGGRRCPPIIRSWPKDLRKYVSFHPLSSMDFFAYLDQRQISLDLTLVDGNHDYEFALFDLQMAARRTLPSGIIIMDNAEQAGPFDAASTFLNANPAWRELGQAIASHDPSNPFDATRASFPDTSFIVLQGPAFVAIGARSQSWGQRPIERAAASGLALDLARPAKGVLHYQVTLRGFFKNEAPVERKAVGAAQIDSSDQKISLPFDQKIFVESGETPTVEIDLSWQGAEPLALTVPPTTQPA